MIRYAVRGDFQGIWLLLMELHGAQAYFRLTPEKLAKTLALAIDEARCIVAEQGGVIVGTFAWAPAEVYYSDEQFYGDLWMYIIPAARRSMHGLKLRNAMKKAAREQQKKLVVGAVGPDINGARLFGKDFEKMGELFMMRA